MRSSRDGAGLRVLVVAHDAVGASNRQRVAELARVPGLEVSLLSPAWWREEGQRIDVRRQPSADGFVWRVGRTLATGNGTRYLYLDQLVGLLRGFQPDLIDLHEEPFSLAALQVLLGRELLAPRAALVFYSAVNVHRRWRPPYRWIERLVLARADGAYAPSEQVPPILGAKGLRAPALAIPLGVDLERFARAERDGLEARLAGAPRPYVGFLGRLEPVKGLGVLVEAAGRLERPATVVVAGDGPERGRLEARVAARGLGDRVRFLPPLPFEQVPGFLKALDLLVLPSVTIPPRHKEQFGRVLAEAMAAGVATVGSSSGAIPEVVGDAGLVVPERDPAALAAAVARLVGDPALRAELGARGRRRAAERFAWPVVASQTVERLYRPAVARRRGPSRVEEVSA